MSEYQPKTEFYTLQKIDRAFKALIENLQNDRNKAEYIYLLFERLIDKNPADDVAKNCLVKSVELMQTSSERAAKSFEGLLKYKAAVHKAQNLPNKDASKNLESFESFTLDND